MTARLQVETSWNKAAHEFESVTMLVTPGGVVKLNTRSNNGVTAAEHNGKIAVFVFSRYAYDAEFGGRTLPTKAFRSFVAKHYKLIKKLVESFSEEHVQNGNLVRTYNEDLSFEIRELCAEFDHKY